MRARVLTFLEAAGHTSSYTYRYILLDKYCCDSMLTVTLKRCILWVKCDWILHTHKYTDMSYTYRIKHIYIYPM